MTLEELFAGRPVSIDEVKARLRKAAEEAGLPWGDRKRTYNSRLAQELGKWAEEQGKGEAFHRALFRAYFADGINLGKIGELLAIARRQGLPEDEARKVLEFRAYRGAVDADWERSRRLGITAVPTFVLNRKGLVGARPYEALADFLEENGVKRRKYERAFL